MEQFAILDVRPIQAGCERFMDRCAFNSYSSTRFTRKTSRKESQLCLHPPMSGITILVKVSLALRKPELVPISILEMRLPLGIPPLLLNWTILAQDKV